MEAVGAARIVADADDLTAQVDMLLGDTHTREKAIKAAHSFASEQTGKLDTIATSLTNALDLT